MNKEDLRALVASTTAGWMPSTDAELSRTPKGRVHQRLIAMLRRSGSSKRELAALRDALIGEINVTSAALIRDALSSVDVLRASYYAIEPAKSSKDPIKRLAFDEVPPASGAREVLSLALALRSTPARQQFIAMEFCDADVDLNNNEHRLYSEPHGGSTEKLALYRTAAQLQKDRTEKLLAQLAPATRVLLDDTQYRFPAAVRYAWALPIEVPRSATDQELQAVAKWTRTAGSAMYRPLPLDDSCCTSKARVFRQAWALYKECGHGLILLSAWTKSLAAATEGKRCEVCYRHVSAGAKHFCTEHKRTAATRQTTRQLHVSRFYKPLVLKDIDASVRLLSRLNAWDFSEITLRKMRDIAKVREVCSEIRQPAAVLATVLRTLKPYMRPHVVDLLERVFGQMLLQAQEPFLASWTDDIEAEMRRQRGRANAPLWLNWEGLVVCLFGAEGGPGWASQRVRGQGLDIEHPSIKSHSVLPSKLVVDLLHLGAWTTVDEVLDEYLYLNPKVLDDLRQTDGRIGRQAMSLAQIGRKVGASHEAVRKNLALADSQLRQMKVGRRAISGGAEKLRRRLRIDAQ